MNKHTTPQRLAFRVAEAADMIGVSPSKMYELLAAGTVPSVRIGCSVRVPADALKRWIAEHTRVNG
jgi:excisionase family DNA binding protein